MMESSPDTVHVYTGAPLEEPLLSKTEDNEQKKTLCPSWVDPTVCTLVILAHAVAVAYQGKNLCACMACGPVLLFAITAYHLHRPAVPALLTTNFTLLTLWSTLRTDYGLYVLLACTQCMMLMLTLQKEEESDEEEEGEDLFLA